MNAPFYEGGFFCGVCKNMRCNKNGSLLGRKHGEVGNWEKKGDHWVYDKDAYEGYVGPEDTDDEEEHGAGAEHNYDDDEEEEDDG